MQICLQDTGFDALGIRGKTPEILKLSFLPPGSWRTRTKVILDNHKSKETGGCKEHNIMPFPILTPSVR